MLTDLVPEAARIGRRIVDLAVYAGDSCTWNVIVMDAARGRGASQVRTATGDLYQGTSGIALFLAELWRITGDQREIDCATSGLRFAMARAEREPPRVSVHAGHIGVAMVAARIAQLTRDDEWHGFIERQLTALDPVLDASEEDIIAGAAGAILGLRRIGAMAHMPKAHDFAVRLGERLLRSASRSPIGWSWHTMTGTVWQDATGYAHGVAGIAHAMLELFALTGDSRWRYAATRAMDYERSCEIRASGDWPDFRSMVLMNAALNRSPADLRDSLRSGALVPPPRAPISARAWCHGSPGIALTRVRAISLGMNDSAIQGELIRALRTTRQSVEETGGSHCLCHGLCGNLESIVLARDVLNIDDSGVIDATMGAALATFGVDKAPWELGVLGKGNYDPSLLVGEAGIGHMLLRLASAEVPSVLCISEWDQPPRPSTDGNHDHRAAELELLLPRVSRAVRTLDDDGGIVETFQGQLSSNTAMTDAVTAIRTAIVRDPSAAGEMLRDALAADDAVLEARGAFTDFVAQYCHELRRLTPSEIDLDVVSVRLAQGTRIVETEWAWSRWSEDESAPEACEDFRLLYRAGQSVVEKPITALQVLILSAMSEPITLQALVQSVSEMVDADATLAAELPTYVRDVVHDAVTIGIADIVE